MSTALNDLDASFLPKAVNLIARVVEHNIAIKIICTRRTQAEQEIALRTGHSWIQHSKHLDGLAIDVCPYDVWQLHGGDKLKWDASDPVWELLGSVGKSLGLVWGGDWHQKDLGHFE